MTGEERPGGQRPGEERPTETLCPVCLATVPALLVATGDDEVVLEGRCPDHGLWRTPVWSGPPSWESWCGAPLVAPTARLGGKPAGAGNAGSGSGEEATVMSPAVTPCPGSCGLCPQHRQRTCTAVLEVTRDCDLGCPVCFADSSPRATEPDLPASRVAELLSALFDAQGAVNLQFSGGEPTRRDDLPDLIRTARAIGFTFVQLNTNGLRLASDDGYAERLRDAGLTSVFLQFDGVGDGVYRTLRGRPLAAQKLQALERCARAGLAVVLVPTLVAGVNDHELGALVRLSAGWAGVVRGLHVQPISYFGRHLEGDRPRLTLPEVLRLLERQTDGDVRAGDFTPSCCEHVRCSFRARYWVREGGRLELVRSERSCCGPKPGSDAQRAIAVTSRQWSLRPSRTAEANEAPNDGLDRFLDDTGKILAISGMLFQDAWNLDMERARRCCVHVVTPHRGLVPFCLWNLTSASGRRLYER